MKRKRPQAPKTRWSKEQMRQIMELRRSNATVPKGGRKPKYNRSKGY